MCKDFGMNSTHEDQIGLTSSLRYLENFKLSDFHRWHWLVRFLVYVQSGNVLAFFEIDSPRKVDIKITYLPLSGCKLQQKKSA